MLCFWHSSKKVIVVIALKNRRNFKMKISRQSVIKQEWLNTICCPVQTALPEYFVVTC